MNDEAGDAYSPPWDWHALPIMAGDASKGRSFEIEQPSGREIWLTRLHQYGTYSGQMVGIPQAQDRTIERALELAVKYWGQNEKPPVILTPRLVQTQLHTSMQDFLDEGLPPAQLPDITCIGEFRSESMQKDALVSIAIVIWYQDAFGLPDDEYILAQLCALDWPAHAWDWEF